MQTSRSSNAPPPVSIPPSLLSSIPPGCCYLTGLPVAPKDRLYIDMPDGATVMVASSELCKALNLKTNKEKDAFLDYFGIDVTRNGQHFLLETKSRRGQPVLHKRIFEVLSRRQLFPA